MSSRTAFSVVVPLTFAMVVGTVPGQTEWTGLCQARAQVAAESKPPAGEKPVPPDRAKIDPAKASRAGESADLKAIRALDEAFVSDYNKGDVKALSAMFAEDAEVFEAEGERYQGRALIEQAFAATFAVDKGARIAIEIGAIRFLSADVAKEEGRSVVTPAKGPPVSRFYTMLCVKRDGRWFITSVREESDPLVRPHDRLRELDWMIGEWVDEATDSEVRVHCAWSEDKNFLLRSFTVKQQGKPVMTVSQRIGWDPLAHQVRSWEFDSEGGFGEGRWSRDGERWVVKHTGVRPEGTTASATNVMSRERPDLIRWASTDRVLGAESIPDQDSYVLVRVPPQPRQKTNGQAPSSPAPSTTRNPR